MAQNDFALDIHRRVTLGRLIEDKARDMSDLLTNVLELVRLESGTDVLNRDWHSVSDLVGLAIARHESRLAGWEVSTDVPGDLPLLSVDSNLMVQMLSNLLENAIKYTPPGTRIHISAQRYEGVIRLVVEARAVVREIHPWPPRRGYWRRRSRSGDLPCRVAIAWR